MNEKRKEFCEQTIETIEERITELLRWINEYSTSKQDKEESAAIKSLIAARAAFVAELDAYRAGDVV